MNKADATRFLRRFNEVADQLSTLSFRGFLGRRVQAEIGWSAGTNEVTSFFDGAGDEAVLAIAPAVRLLIEDGTDLLSFRSLADVYELEFVPESLRLRYRRIREQLNAHLVRPTVVSLGGAPNITAKEMLDDYLYGLALHRNPRHFNRIGPLLMEPLVAPLVKSELQRALSLVVAAGLAARSVNVDLLEALETTGP